MAQQKHLGRIVFIGNEHLYGGKKKGRRAVVTKIDKSSNARLAGIRSLHDKDGKPRKELTPLKGKYVSLPKPSGVDTQDRAISKKTKQKFNLLSQTPAIKPTSDRLTKTDYKNVMRGIEKRRHGKK